MAVPTIITLPPTNLTETSIRMNARITDTGGKPVTSIGWSYQASCCSNSMSVPASVPTAPTDVYQSNDVVKGTRFRYRVRATNADGQSEYTEFTEYYTTIGSSPFPLCITLPAIVSGTSVTLRGETTYLSDGGCTSRRFEWKLAGADWNGWEWEENGSFGLGAFEHSLTLGAGSYVYRAKVVGKIYKPPYWQINSSTCSVIDIADNEETFVVVAKPEAPTNLVATAISDAQIDVGWTRGAGALNTVVRRKIGSYPTDVADGDEAYNGPSDDFSDTGLDPSTTYYYRAWSYTDPHYSDDYAEDFATTFIAPPPIVPPSVTTESANTISQPGATLNGVLDDDGGEACACWFSHGVPGGTIYTTPLQTKSSGELFSQALTDLTPGTRYHFRAVARNSTGITYGTNMYFVTESPPLREFPVVQQELLELLRR